MKALLLISVLLTTSSVAPISEDAHAKTVEYDYNNDGDGNYQFSFKTSNGLRRSEFGILLNRGRSDEHLQVRGSYSYTDQDGKYVKINYMADVNGYNVVKDLGPQTKKGIEKESLDPKVLATLLGG